MPASDPRSERSHGGGALLAAALLVATAGPAGGVLVRGSRPLHVRYVSPPIAIPPDGRLRFSLGIATPPPPPEAAPMPPDLATASLMRGRDPAGAAYEQPPAVTPAHFRIEVLN